MSSACQWLTVFLLVGSIVAYCLIDPKVSSDAYWIRVGIASVAMTFLCLSFFYFIRSNPRRVYIVTGTVVPRRRVDLDVADKEFWLPTQASDEKNAAHSSICSICLADASEHQTRCCNSFLHKDCAATYWRSANEVICPNCRHTVPQHSTADFA